MEELKKQGQTAGVEVETQPTETQLPKKITKETLQPKDPKKAI
jgi:hypothetical protein